MGLAGYHLLAFGLGALLAVYLPVLGQSGRIVGSPILANVPFFAAGLATSFVLTLAMGNRLADFGRLREVPPWMYLAGVASGMMILGSTFLLPRIGPGPFFVLLVAGQILVGALLSHYGLLGAPLDAVSTRRLAGLALVVGGAWLVVMR